MFNRNLNTRLFNERTVSPSPRIPLAGGEFIAERDQHENFSKGHVMPMSERSGVAVGKFISQSTETVLPAQAAWGRTLEGRPYITLRSHSEDGDDSAIEVRQGFHEEHGGLTTVEERYESEERLPPEGVGPEIRRIQARLRAERLEDDRDL